MNYLATRKQLDDIATAQIGPRNIQKSASSAYSSVYAVENSEGVSNTAEESSIDASLGLIPNREKKRMENFTVVDVNQADVIASWDSNRNMSQTER